MKPVFVLFVFFVAIAGSGCSSPPRRTAPATDHIAELLAHPEAPTVAREHPTFFRFVATKLADLEHDLALPK